MTEEQIRQIIRDELIHRLGTFDRLDRFSFEKSIHILDGRDIQIGQTNGTKIGTTADEKIGFYGKTPVTQGNSIATPSGGATQDAEARLAIGYLITALQTIGIISL